MTGQSISGAPVEIINSSQKMQRTPKTSCRNQYANFQPKWYSEIVSNRPLVPQQISRTLAVSQAAESQVKMQAVMGTLLAHRASVTSKWVSNLPLLFQRGAMSTPGVPMTKVNWVSVLKLPHTSQYRFHRSDLHRSTRSRE